MKIIEFAVQRLSKAILVVIGVVILNFLLIHMAPGDPASVLAGEAGAGDAKFIDPQSDPGDGPVDVLPLSARSPQALMALAQRYEAWLNSHPDVDISDVCFTAGAGRSHFEHRAALVVEAGGGRPGVGVADLDPRRRIAGLLEGLRDDERHRLAPVADPVVGQERFGQAEGHAAGRRRLVRGGVGRLGRGVEMGHHQEDARNGGGCPRVDGGDAAGRDRGADDEAVGGLALSGPDPEADNSPVLWAVPPEAPSPA